MTKVFPITFDKFIEAFKTNEFIFVEISLACIGLTKITAGIPVAIEKLNIIKNKSRAQSLPPLRLKFKTIVDLKFFFIPIDDFNNSSFDDPMA